MRHATISTRASELRRTSDSLRSAGSALRQYAEVLERGQLLIASIQRRIGDLKDDERDDNPDTLEDESVDNSGKIRGLERQITGILNEISDAAVAAAASLNGLEVTSAPTEAGMFSALADSTGLTATMAELDRLRTAPTGSWENLFSSAINGVAGADQMVGMFFDRNVMDGALWRERVAAYMDGDQMSDVWSFFSPEMDADLRLYAARAEMAWRRLSEDAPETNWDATARLLANLPVALNQKMDEFNEWVNVPGYWDPDGEAGWIPPLSKGRLPWQPIPTTNQVAETEARQLAAAAAFDETWARVSEDWERVNEGGGSFAYYGGGLEFKDWSIGGTKLDDWYQAPGEHAHFETGPLIELGYAEMFKKIQSLASSGGIGIAPGEGAHRLREGLVFIQPGKGQLHGKWGKAKIGFGPGVVVALTPGETEADPWSLSLGLLFNIGAEFKVGRIGAELEAGVGGYLTFEPWGSAEPHAGELPPAADQGHAIPGTTPTTAPAAPATAPATGPTVIPGMPATPPAQPPAQPPAAPPVAPVTPMQPAPPAQPPAAPPAPPAPVPQAYTIQPGDTLRGIATDHLPPGQRSEQDIQAYWKEIYRLNRSVLGPNPDLIHTGVELTIPPPPSALPAAS
jgi:hypothetical protein